MSQKLLDEFDRVLLQARLECTTCAKPGEPLCKSEHNLYQCTRTLGHNGKHAACGSFHHPIIEWDNQWTKP